MQGLSDFRFAFTRGALLLFALMAAVSCGGAERSSAPVLPGVQEGKGKGAAIAATARSLKGTPYRYGGASPRTGFDCSGLAFYVYQVNGVAIPRVTDAQLGSGARVKLADVIPGDLLFFDGEGKGGLHVGIFTGGSERLFVHSPKSGATVREDSLANPYWRGAYRAARRPWPASL